MDKMSWVLTAALAAAVIFMLMRSGGDTSGEEAARLVAEGAVLVDVRTPGEFNGNAIAGAINVPLQVLPQRLSSVGEKSAPVVLYCRSGARSSTAKGILLKAGYTNVHDLGSIGNWPSN